jgi:hypothetical protein
MRTRGPGSGRPGRAGDKVLVNPDWAPRAVGSSMLLPREKTVAPAAPIKTVARGSAEATRDTPRFTAKVTHSGGGYVELLVDRDTESYPEEGSRVEVRVVHQGSVRDARDLDWFRHFWLRLYGDVPRVGQALASWRYDLRRTMLGHHVPLAAEERDRATPRR